MISTPPITTFFLIIIIFQTYSVTRMVPDSAATASAMFSGVKTVGYTLGFDSHIVNNDPGNL